MSNKQKVKLARKIAHIVGGVMIAAGALLALGTAGASDCGEISMNVVVIREIIACVVICVGAVIADLN